MNKNKTVGAEDLQIQNEYYQYDPFQSSSLLDSSVPINDLK